MRGVALAVVVAALALVPVAGAQTAPLGIDVSHWQGQIGWLQVGAAGYDFAFAKATEGTTYTDPTYGTNRAGAGAAGIKFGAYHFARPAAGSDAAAVASGIAQADALSRTRSRGAAISSPCSTWRRTAASRSHDSCSG